MPLHRKSKSLLCRMLPPPGSRLSSETRGFCSHSSLPRNPVFLISLTSSSFVSSGSSLTSGSYCPSPSPAATPLSLLPPPPAPRETLLTSQVPTRMTAGHSPLRKPLVSLPVGPCHPIYTLVWLPAGGRLPKPGSVLYPWQRFRGFRVRWVPVALVRE